MTGVVMNALRGGPSGYPLDSLIRHGNFGHTMVIGGCSKLDGGLNNILAVATGIAMIILGSLIFNPHVDFTSKPSHSAV